VLLGFPSDRVVTDKKSSWILIYWNTKAGIYTEMVGIIKMANEIMSIYWKGEERGLKLRVGDNSKRLRKFLWWDIFINGFANYSKSPKISIHLELLQKKAVVDKMEGNKANTAACWPGRKRLKAFRSFRRPPPSTRECSPCAWGCPRGRWLKTNRKQMYKLPEVIADD